jgi:predicted secreted protein
MTFIDERPPLSPGDTNILDPMMKAMTIIENQITTLQGELAIYLLTDGEPDNSDTGYVFEMNTATIVSKITDRNKNLKAKVHTFSIPGGRLWLKDMSDNNWGTYTPVGN